MAHWTLESRDILRRNTAKQGLFIVVSQGYRIRSYNKRDEHRSPPDPVAASVVRIFQQSIITQSAAVGGPGDSPSGWAHARKLFKEKKAEL
ncbi:hypothetical protein IFM47457_08216 [Aspergillus lentulus]|nr:hypothetical protein IFM47457_08216 [Aspergillus lentulus]